MSEPFLGEIRLFAFDFAPRGWALCNGQLLPINQNQALFSLLGTMYGGDGRTTFALPNLQGRVPLHMGSGYSQGQQGGEQAHTLSIAELPQHLHQPTATTNAATPATSAPSASLMLGQSAFAALYGPASNLQAMDGKAISNAGGSQAHQNMQPYLVISFCIALSGIFPSRS